MSARPVPEFVREFNPGTTPRPLSPPVPLGEWYDAGVPPVPWLLNGWLVHRGISILAGPGGCGKSTAASDMALVLSGDVDPETGTTRKWLGIPPTCVCKVIYFDMEQGAPTLARTMLRLGRPNGNLTVIADDPVSLRTDESAAHLEDYILEHYGDPELSSMPLVLVVDSLIHLAGGVDENDNTAMAGIFSRMFRISEKYRAAWVVVHHSRKNVPGGSQLDSVRGASAIRDQSAIVAVMGHYGDARRVEQVKNRYSHQRNLVVNLVRDQSEDTDPDTCPMRLEAGDTLAQPFSQTHQNMGKVTDWLRDSVMLKKAELVECGRLAVPSIGPVQMTETLRRGLSMGILAQPKYGYYSLAQANGDATGDGYGPD